MTRSRPESRLEPTGLVVAVIAISVLTFTAPLLTHGPLPRGSDVYAASHYLQGFMKAFGEGDLYPRWTDETNRSLGAPSFVLFPPLVFYGAGAASWLTGSLISGFKLYMFVVALATGLSFYALARQWIGPGLPAALASGLYLLLPYHVLDMYQRFAMPESTSFIFFPLILLFARKVMLTGKARDVMGLSFSYAGLVYTHLVSAYMFSLFLGLWLIWDARGAWRRLAGPVMGLACGLALAAPALLPAALEKSHVNIGWVREAPNGDFRINFIFRDDVLPGLGFKDPVKPPVLKSAHSQLALAVVAAVMALAWTSAGQTRRRRDIMSLAGACSAAYLLQLEISTPIWRLVPELATIQFPWRFQTIMVLTAALLCGYALSSGWGRQSAGRRLIGAGWAALAAAALVNLALAAQNAYLYPFTYDEALNRDPGVVHWSDPSTTPVGFEPYRQFKRMRFAKPRVAFVKGSGSARVVRWASSTRSFAIDSRGGGLVEVGSFWFPGWTATRDGQPLELEASPREALIRFRVPPGAHTVEMRFGTTPVRRAARYVGLGGVLVLPLLGWATGRVSGPGRSPRSRTGDP